jgi:hypothetical protein
MTIFSSPKVSFYKKFRLVRPLINALADENKWVRYHAAQALEEIGDPRALDGLRALLEESKPGWWIEDVGQTMHELAPHYPGGDEIIDAVNAYSRQWDYKLRLAAEAAIAQIESKSQNLE